MTEKWTPPDRVWLLTWGDDAPHGYIGFEGLICESEPEDVTERDLVYIRATPEREAAPDLYEALERYRSVQRRMLEKWADGDDLVRNTLWQALHRCEQAADAALAKAEGKTEGEGK